MFTSKANQRIWELKAAGSHLIAEVRRLERELEDARNELQKQKDVRSGLIARVSRLEREWEDARTDSRNRERA